MTLSADDREYYLALKTTAQQAMIDLLSRPVVSYKIKGREVVYRSFAEAERALALAYKYLGRGLTIVKPRIRR